MLSSGVFNDILQSEQFLLMLILLIALSEHVAVSRQYVCFTKHHQLKFACMLQVTY